MVPNMGLAADQEVKGRSFPFMQFEHFLLHILYFVKQTRHAKLTPQHALPMFTDVTGRGTGAHKDTSYPVAFGRLCSFNKGHLRTATILPDRWGTGLYTGHLTLPVHIVFSAIRDTSQPISAFLCKGSLLEMPASKI